MATQQPGLRLGTQVANADLRTKQFHFAQVITGSKVDIVNAAGEASVGVLQNKPNTGEVADIMVTGVSKVVASAALALGANPVQISAAADGRAKVAATTEVVIGILITGTSAANELAEVLLGAPGSGGRIP